MYLQAVHSIEDYEEKMSNATPLVLLITEMPVRSKSSLLSSEKYCPNYKLARRLSRFT
jgi:hypothetical protein